ncbi:hypothetical protein BWI93_22480 [Siphonobacter sp. BAB-5385]|nr:hypothetical protein BWI93_22480 [Siphonobacter sp. BAB-5385]
MKWLSNVRIYAWVLVKKGKSMKKTTFLLLVLAVACQKNKSVEPVLRPCLAENAATDVKTFRQQLLGKWKLVYTSSSVTNYTAPVPNVEMIFADTNHIEVRKEKSVLYKGSYQLIKLEKGVAIADSLGLARYGTRPDNYLSGRLFVCPEAMQIDLAVGSYVDLPNRLFKRLQ